MPIRVKFSSFRRRVAAASSIRSAAVDYTQLARSIQNPPETKPEQRRILRKTVKVRENLIRALRLYDGVPSTPQIEKRKTTIHRLLDTIEEYIIDLRLQVG